MTRVFSTIAFFLFFGLRAAFAQQGEAMWVQIEAHPSLREAQARAQIYSNALADVNGFRLGQGWYAIVLGPYARPDAEQVLRVYRAERQIPQDSFLARSNSLGQQFWPIGANILNRGVVAPPVQPAPEQPQATVQTPAQPSDETPAEARQSERLLTADERKGLQTALQAAGFYNSAIDGAFGRGTRRSMADWQQFNGFEATGILTTQQRKVLMDEYNAPLISAGMQRRSDTETGIEIDLPLAVTRFDRYEAPFAHFESSSDIGAQVLLISQEGSAATLRGLYDVMQTLEIVPLDGPRNRAKNSFTLEGRGNGIVSYTEAALKDGEIKGFTLVWPKGDEARRTRVLAAMKASFSRIEGVLDAGAGANAEQRVDLVSGLAIRKPRLSRSGFYVDGEGAVATVAEAVEGCTRITLDREHEAQVISTDADLGVALLRPTDALSPMAVAQLTTTEPRLQSEVTLSGYSYEGVLGAPTLTYGTLADVRGLGGEAELARLALAAQEGDAGGPVFDAGGSVLGMLLATPKTGQDLPGDVSFAADAAALTDLLSSAGLSAQESPGGEPVSPDELNRRAQGMTVLVSCWD
ncbi:serine protease [Ruegeria sp. HKCCD8929]|uniref:serine protease n=1 Tax=Ruegeria sp. HKCCD8929 TaxID=2683006 RepID=UPI0014897AB5|nr:serine protease [Ruegeria sp. HKCCD8929]